MADSYPKAYLYKRLVQAKLFIDAHFSDQIDLANIADEACFSRFHFIRLFKSVYGKTPHQYLIKVRVENAKRLLENGNSITDTCLSVGFDSVSSFTSLFRKFTRLTPSIYQQQYQERRELMAQTPLQFIPTCFAEQKGWLRKSNFEELG